MKAQPGIRDIAVIGAGSWGTALAVQLARGGHGATLWGRSRSHLEDMSGQRCNTRYLPGVRFPDTLDIDGDLAGVAATHRDLLVCVPSHAFRATLAGLMPQLRPESRIAWATKGFEQGSGALPHEVAREELGADRDLAVVSGPTFATEVGLGLPTAMTVAATSATFAADLARRFSDAQFRAYTSNDMTGVEVGGGVKNVLAIGAGISDGLGFGANTRIALITRGLLEMTRLGIALGARAETFMGLSGMGDLVLTCTDDQSRNRRLGLMLAKGMPLADAVRDIGQVVEGVYAAGAVHDVATRLGLEMPICEQVQRILYAGASPDEAVRILMSRSLKPESELDL